MINNFFNSNVFFEIGEVIGNVGKRIKRRSNPDLVDRIFRKRLAQISVELPLEPGRFKEPDGDTIDAEYRILDESEGEDEYVE